MNVEMTYEQYQEMMEDLSIVISKEINKPKLKEPPMRIHKIKQNVITLLPTGHIKMDDIIFDTVDELAVYLKKIQKEHNIVEEVNPYLLYQPIYKSGL